MNPLISKKNLVPRIIINGYQIRDMAKPCTEDRIYKISPILYFRLSCELREAPHRKKYNLNKFRYELNNKQ